MFSKSIFKLIAVLLAAIIGLSVYWYSKDLQRDSVTETSQLPLELASEVENVLKSKADIFRPILKSETIIDEIKKSNKEHQGITEEQIADLDSAFRHSRAEDEFASRFLTNPAAKTLIDFQESNPAFSEIFVTDKFGLNVGQTNMTSDLYQADEDWWAGAYNSGRGKEYHGAIEFDESAQAEAISYYFPIFDTGNDEVIGIAKAVISIAAIKLEL